MQTQGKELGEEKNAWIERNKKSIVDIGNPLGKNVRITSEGARPVTNDLNAYIVVEAESADDVVAMFKDNPHWVVPSAFLDIMEVSHMGM